MNEQVASLYADIGIKIAGALRGLRDFRSRLMSSQNALKTLRDQAKITGLTLSVGLTAPLALLGKTAVSSLADAGKSLNVFQLATKASTGEMEEARAKVAELARDLTLPGVTSAVAASALAELGKAGLSARDAIAALRPSLLLATAGEIEASEAAQILANTLSAFKLPGTEAARVADLLAGAEIAAAGSIRDHALALSQSSAVWAQAKVPVEDLVTSIGLLGNAGILGSDAGTSLRTMMLRLIAPTEEAAGMMRAMGISVYDAEGKMKPFREIIDQFHRGLEPLTEAQRNQRLETIFGSDAIRAAVTIFGGGTAAFDAMKTAVTQQGLAQELATAKTEGLAGAIDNIGKVTNLAAEAGVKPFEKDIQVLIGAAATAVLWFADLDEGTRRTIGWFALGVVAAGGIALAISGVTAVAGSLVTGLGFLAGALAFVAANPVVLIVGALIALGAWLVYLYNTSETFRNTINGAFSAVSTAVSTMWNHVRPILEAFLSVLGGLLGALGVMPTSVSLPSVSAPPQAPNYGPGNRWAPPAAQGFVGGVPIEGRAAGGSVLSGQPYMVGEAGPELFVPSRSGGIVPNGQAGGLILNFNGPVYGMTDFEDEVIRLLDVARRRARA